MRRVDDPDWRSPALAALGSLEAEMDGLKVIAKLYAEQEKPGAPSGASSPVARTPMTPDPRWQTVRRSLISYSEARAALDALEEEHRNAMALALKGQTRECEIVRLEAEVERLKQARTRRLPEDDVAVVQMALDAFSCSGRDDELADRAVNAFSRLKRLRVDIDGRVRLLEPGDSLHLTEGADWSWGAKSGKSTVTFVWDWDGKTLRTRS